MITEQPDTFQLGKIFYSFIINKTMAKTILTFKSQCFNAQKNQSGASLQFAKQIQQSDKGPTAREVIVVNVKDQKVADSFEVMGKEYTITITE
jgi:hypothetical protein